MEALTSGWLGALGAVWVVLTTLWLVLVVYRAMIGNREDDQLFLGKGEDHMAEEQRALANRLVKLGKPIWTLGVLSGALLVTIVTAWLWTGLRTNL